MKKNPTTPTNPTAPPALSQASVSSLVQGLRVLQEKRVVAGDSEAVGALAAAEGCIRKLWSERHPEPSIPGLPGKVTKRST